VASRFHDGTTEIEVVNTIACGEDIVFVVLVEWNMTRFDEDPRPRPWVLRSTMLFRRDGNKWTMLHRQLGHASPSPPRTTTRHIGSGRHCANTL
jgi:ketosteroid isomerase-like protein